MSEFSTGPAAVTAHRMLGFPLFESLVALAVFSSGGDLDADPHQSEPCSLRALLEARTYAGFVADNVLVETRLAQALVQGRKRFRRYPYGWF